MIKELKKLPTISSLKKISWKNIDLVFLSLPNGEAQKIIKDFKFNHLKYIDLSADFRIQDPRIWNNMEDHKAKNLIKIDLLN